jgi:peptidyl-prolyl cis-trans isomerase B (cyclophilin B)
MAEAAQPKVVLETNHGAITIALDAEKAPVSVANFLQYVDNGFYNGTIFHRIIPTFMIQGGGFEPGMRQKKGRAPIQNEAKNGLKNKRGAIAMARTNEPHSATSQFFINVSDNGFLDYPGQDGWGYAVFGEVVDGMDVVEKIKNVETTQHGMYDDVPKQDVVMQSVRRVEA